jgi:hypothetical protein
MTARLRRILLALVQPTAGEPIDVSLWSVNRTGDFLEVVASLIAPGMDVFCAGAKINEREKPKGKNTFDSKRPK